MAQLGRFEAVVRSSAGLALSGVSVTLYREGATVNGNQSGTSPLTVTVRDNGKIEASDEAFINTTTGTLYTVVSVTDTTVVLSWLGGSTLNLTNGDRIVPNNAKPTLYGDDQGGTSTTNPLTTSATGYASGYLEAGAYEVINSGGLSTTTLWQASVTVTETPGQVRYADAYAANSVTGGIQEAIEDLPSTGGKVVLSARTYTVDVPIDINLSSVWLQGAGPGTVVTISSSFPAQVAGEVDGIIRTPNTVASSTARSNIKISDLKIDCARSLARDVYAAIGLHDVTDVEIRDVIATNGENFGILVDASTRVTISGCHVFDFNDNANSNGIGVSGNNQAGTAGRSATITNNIVEDIGTIGINLQSYDGAVIAGNMVYSCQYGIMLEGNTAAGSAAGDTVRDVTISGNTLIGTTATNDAGTTQNAIAIVLWLRDTAGGLSTDTENYSLAITGNTIKDYKSALKSGGGHWLFAHNTIYNYGNGGGNASGICVGEVFGTNLRVDHVAIVGNYMRQDTRGSGSECAAIVIDNSTAAGTIDNVIIRDNIINGQDLTAGAPSQHGIWLKNPGSNYEITGNFLYNITTIPIRGAFANVSGAAPSNWNIARNTIINPNAISGGSANTAISMADANNFTWSKVSVVGNVARDANSRMNRLFTYSGTGWAGALIVRDNVARDVSTGLIQITANADLYDVRNNVPEAAVLQAIAAATDTIVSGCVTVMLTGPAGTTLMTSAPTIADGYNGQRITLINVDSADVIEIQDQGTLASSNLRLVGTKVTLNPRESVVLEYNAQIGDWVQIAASGNVT